MRISDWSSDVCSSDLIPARPVTVGVFGAVPSPASFAYRDGALIGDFVKTAGGIQKIGDKSEIFVVRANGTVLAGGKRALRAPALPGDLVYVPIDADRGEFWARLRDITGPQFSGLVGAASIAAIRSTALRAGTEWVSPLK